MFLTVSPMYTAVGETHESAPSAHSHHSHVPHESSRAMSYARIRTLGAEEHVDRVAEVPERAAGVHLASKVGEVVGLGVDVGDGLELHADEREVAPVLRCVRERSTRAARDGGNAFETH